MATLTKHVLGLPKGSIADSISFSTWKGKATIKSLPSSYNDANTEAQQAQRAKWSLIGQTLVPLASIVDIGWKAYEQSGRKALTALNAYMKYHLTQVPAEELFNGTAPEYDSINADKLLVARGALSTHSNASYMAGQVTVEFPADYDMNNIVYACFYNPTAQEAVYASAQCAESVTISIAPRSDWTGVNYLYVFETSADGTKASNSEVSAY